MNLPPADLQRLLAEEPFVRALASSLIADEADDVVQQAFLRAIEQRPSSVREPRSWLARIVRNLASDHRRNRSRREAREHAASVHPLVPSSSDLVEAEERRRELVAAVDGLPEHLRTVVLLRWFEGLPPRRIAKDLGLPVAVVWNRLHAALVALRQRLDAAHGGDRRAWLLPLVPFASSPRALPWHELAGPSASAPSFSLGVIAMTTKMKTAAIVAAVVLAATWMCWPWSGALTPPSKNGVAAAAAAESVRGTLPALADESAAAAAARVAAAVPATAATTGSLIVTVRYADEPSIAVGRMVIVRRAGADFRVGLHRAVTDDAGVARFDGLAAGSVRVRVTGTEVREGADIVAGATTAFTLTVRGGVTLTGIVVDAAGAPVGRAIVEAGIPAFTGEDADQVATTAADGTFTIRACCRVGVVGARARGFAASKMYFYQNVKGPTEHVRIELLAVGGVVEGVVVGPAGHPVAGAVVRIGEGRTESILSTNQGAAPLPAQVHTDAEGRFVAVGLPVGTQPIQVRAVGLAPWRGACEAVSAGSTAVRIAMESAAECVGIVRDEQGQPVAEATLSVGADEDFVVLRARTAADGTFTLRELPTGEVEVAASKANVGKAVVRVHATAGTSVPCELRLSNGLALRGRVVDDTGEPIAGAEVRCVAEGSGARWSERVGSDLQGRFAVPDCPAGTTLTVAVSALDRLSWQRRAIDPHAGELTVVLSKDARPRARIIGRLLDADGRGAIDVEVEAWRQQPQQYAETKVRDAAGNFAIEVGPGPWGIRILTRTHPEIRRAPRELAPNETWDLGTLQLVRGGTLVVRDESTVKLQYTVIDAEERGVCALFGPVRPLRSDLLAPGDYRLLVWGDGVAAQAPRFTIRAGEETSLDVRTSPGVQVQVQCVLPSAEEPPSWIAFEVRRDGSIVSSTSVTRTGAFKGEVWLAPGSYELISRNRPVRTVVPFTVREGMAEPVRVELR